MSSIPSESCTCSAGVPRGGLFERSLRFARTQQRLPPMSTWPTRSAAAPEPLGHTWRLPSDCSRSSTSRCGTRYAAEIEELKTRLNNG